MDKTERDTSKWFDADIMRKPAINDRIVSKAMGPGKYADSTDKQTS